MEDFLNCLNETFFSILLFQIRFGHDFFKDESVQGRVSRPVSETIFIDYTNVKVLFRFNDFKPKFLIETDGILVRGLDVEVNSVLAINFTDQVVWQLLRIVYNQFISFKSVTHCHTTGWWNRDQGARACDGVHQELGPDAWLSVECKTAEGHDVKVSASHFNWWWAHVIGSGCDLGDLDSARDCTYKGSPHKGQSGYGVGIFPQETLVKLVVVRNWKNHLKSKIFI